MKRAKLDQNAMAIMGDQITTELVSGLMVRMTTMVRDFDTPPLDAASVVYSVAVSTLANLVSTLRSMGVPVTEDTVIDAVRAALAITPEVKVLNIAFGKVTDFSRPN